MFTFCGYELELVVDAVLDRQRGPALWSASDATGGHWLILEAGRDPNHPAWLCAADQPAGARRGERWPAPH